MNAFEKISLYKQRIVKWIADQKLGHLYKEPTPEEFGITKGQELFIAQREREKLITESFKTPFRK